ncbi:hypothetical protein T310_3337 [Rasamsonia emersonii CBS 393.64]|uniref:Uncharacterized protein n=1 Tax=Rasamsonia emersonii (strain ATCC 16479 / CBS 393.64 / IMI 116815) TaxID=1408163 RepID=A0A0F4YX52_RASE3|nr:hypothetical protein T310_3337 [Rasamsonia emersonii CBS 393.64]KKA22655.1 hypothetical protein T310_3337 [Rasamsonia emersonii CBS 393.64]
MPSQVTTNVSQYHIADLYPLSQSQCFPDTVRCVKIENNNNTTTDKFYAAARNAFGDGLIDSPNLIFRGLSLTALELSMTYFIPVIDTKSIDKDSAPGIYATDSFAMAKSYAQSNGAIMVFKDTDYYRDMTVWRPDQDEWKHLTAAWLLRLPLNDVSVSSKYKTADTIIGPASKTRGGQKAFQNKARRTRWCLLATRDVNA